MLSSLPSAPFDRLPFPTYVLSKPTAIHLFSLKLHSDPTKLLLQVLKYSSALVSSVEAHVFLQYLH